MASGASTPSAASPASSLQIWLALGVVYVVWGSTYLAIRYAVDTLPPLSMAGVRSFVAGAVLCGWSRWRAAPSEPAPGWPQWRSAAIVGIALLTGGNGGVVWAERTIDSGIAALVVGGLPLWMALLGRLVYGERLGRRALIGLPLGFAGIAWLVGPVDAGGIEPVGGLVLVAASISWAAGSLYARRAPLPRQPLLSTGMQMLCGGGLLLVLGALAGEGSRFAWAQVSTTSLAALLYLIVFGSLLAFTAYSWLLQAAPVALVSTYAYVNPIVAVLLGWAIRGEPVTTRMVGAGGAIVVAVLLIATERRPGA